MSAKREHRRLMVTGENSGVISNDADGDVRAPSEHVLVVMESTFPASQFHVALLVTRRPTL
jgi:hypothetical protein